MLGIITSIIIVAVKHVSCCKASTSIDWQQFYQALFYTKKLEKFEKVYIIGSIVIQLGRPETPFVTNYLSIYKKWWYKIYYKALQTIDSMR